MLKTHTHEFVANAQDRQERETLGYKPSEHATKPGTDDCQNQRITRGRF